jgi:hypothetical protein
MVSRRRRVWSGATRRAEPELKLQGSAVQIKWNKGND